MGGNGRLLDNDEVEFLLKGGENDSPGFTATAFAAPEREEDPPEVTMRGDLDKINLSDIFQALAISKIGGLLRVKGALETREIHFQDGIVRCLVPQRVETLRLGQRLVRAGLISAEQLRSALLEQRKSRATLGEILRQQELVSLEEVDEIVASQLHEDLFGLFTWPQGTFEFYRGEITDPVVEQRLNESPGFEVNGVLLEVARRSDEWERVMASVGSLEELLIATEGSTPDGLDADQLSVWESADGQLTIRQLAEQTLIGVFECGRVVRELLCEGLLRKLTAAETIESATALAAGEPRNAVVVMRALLGRGEHYDIDTVEQIGSLLGQCGENRQAADYILRAAHDFDHAEDQVRLARHARALDKLSADVLSFLTDALQRTEAPDPTELTDVLADLVDALANSGNYEDALTVVEELEATTGDLPLCLPRKARVLSKLGQSDEAIEALIQLVDFYKEHGNREQVTSVYEQILKIDYRRKDIARALKALHASKLARRGRLAGIAAALAILAFAGYVQIGSMVRQANLDEVEMLVELAIANEDLPRASELVRSATLRFGESERTLALDALLQSVEQRRAEMVANDIEQARSETLAEAIKLLRDGRVADALAKFARLGEQGINENMVAATIKSAISTVLPNLERIAESLPERMPPPPALEQRPTDQQTILDQLRQDLQLPILDTASGLLAARENPMLRSALGREFAPLVELVEKIARLRQRVETLEALYSARLERRSLAKELTPLFHEAREHELDNRFESALRAYRTLMRNHPENDELRAHFEERVERYSTILRYLQIVGDATDRGDFATAQGQFRAMQRQFPKLPFDSIVRLPLRIRTTPPGAGVFIDGKLVGEAPLLASYRPAERTRIRIELDGFQPEETELTGDAVGLVLSLLARVTQWTALRDGTIDRPPAQGGGSRLFVTDRAGAISSLRARDGALLWSISTGDLSGMLTAPCMLQDETLVVGSIDGRLRCLRGSDGGELWAVDDVPTESRPVSHGAAVLCATEDARLLAFRVADGRRIWSTALPGPVHADLLSMDDRSVIAITSTGSAVAIDPSNGRVRWQASVGNGVVCSPARLGSRLVVASEDGQLTMLDATDGRVVWAADGFSNLVLSPAMTDRWVLVPDGRELHVLEISNGRRVRTIRHETDLTAHLSRIHDLVFVGDAAGVVRAIDVETLEPRFVLRADGPALAPVSELADGTLIASFQDRTIRAYRPVGR